MPRLLAFAMLAVGCALLLAPLAASWVQGFEMEQRVSQINSTIQATSTDDAAAFVPLREKLQAYNENAAGGQKSINDPFGFTQEEQVLADFGLEEGLIGAITIPKISCELPLYLGASEGNMSKGAAVIAGTSIPLGTAGSNSVIAGHRGYNGSEMFLSLGELVPGDVVGLTTPWANMTYVVSEVRVVSPYDTEALRIVPGKDLITLFTCHPYGQNSKRLLVICERDDSTVQDEPSAPLERAARTVERIAAGQADAVDAERGMRVAGLVLVGFFAIFALAHKARRG